MTRQEATQKATELVSKMTVEEAASQLKYDSPAIERLGIPEYNWWNEALHGVARAGTATCFPQAVALAATFDDDLLLEIAKSISLEARAKYNEFSKHGDRSIYKGVTMWTPNINIFRDPRWGRGQETYGEDPYLTSVMGCAMVEGLQQEKDGYMMAAACAKHFAVHSGPEELRHEFDAEVSQKDLWETYLPAFEACVKKAGVEAVMGAYNRTNSEPCCAHKYLMDEILRGRWGFEGHFVSDCWAIRDFHEHHHVTNCPEESVELALKRGCDLNCGCTYEHVLEAYRQGKVTREDINRSAVRLFTTRYLLGLFDNSELDKIPYSVVSCSAHLELAYKAAVESCVLLKNDGILPLEKDAYKTIAVVGPNADSKDALIGNYYGTPPRTVTLLDGISALCREYGIELHYSEGSHLYDTLENAKPSQKYRVTEGRIAAENSDLVIVCTGLDATLEGEQGDRGNYFASGDKPDLLLPPSQRLLLDAIVETKKPFVILNASGSAVDLSAYEEKANAIIQVWYPGGEGGRAVADILFGNAAPQGKLPITFYYNDNDLPPMTDYSMKGRTYRYIEQKPWKPFGFGLTYGTLKILETKSDIKDYKAASERGITLTVKCANKNDTSVSDVIQVYVRVTGAKNEVPNHKLAAFKRIRLGSAQTADYTIYVAPDAFTTVDDSGVRNADGDGAKIYIGFSQPNKGDNDYIEIV